MRRVIIIAGAAAMMWPCSLARAQERRILTDGLPRTAWARKLVGGPVGGVFLATYTAHVDVHELMQRFAIEGRVVPLSSREGGHENFGLVGHYWPDLMKTEGQILDDVRDALKSDWELVSLRESPHWSKYPQDVRRSILSAVVLGKTLLISGMSDEFKADLKAAGVELEPIEIGSGRFIFLDTKPDTPRFYRCGQGLIVHFAVGVSGSKFRSDFEFHAARCGWILWRAARPETPLCINSTTVRSGSVLVQTADQPDGPEFRLDLAVHWRESYERVFAETKKAKPGTRVAAELPYLATGEYVVEVRAVNAEGVTLDWDALMFRNAGPIAVKAVRVDRRKVSENDRVACRLEVEGPTADLKMQVRFYDNWYRLLTTDVRPFSDAFTIIVPAGSLSVINHVEVSLLSKRGTEAIGSAELVMPDKVRPTDFYVLSWAGAGESWPQRLWCDVLRRQAGLDGVSNVGHDAGAARAAAVNHLRVIPYTTFLHAKKLDEELFNEKWLGDMEERCRTAGREQRPYNTLAYTLGDENFVDAFSPKGRFCDTPEAWKRFRRYLREVYPGLEAVNAQWGTRFRDWEEIHFKSESDMLPSLDNPSAWTDYRMWITREFTAVNRRFRAAIQTEHPGAWVGWDGAEQFSSYDGYDWWELTKGMELTQVYHSYIVPGIHSNKIFNGQAVKSFRPGAKLSGGWMNSADRHYGGQYVPWYLCLNGWNSVWWWHAAWPDPINGMCNWDLSLTPVVADMARSVREIKRGPATLLAHARKQVDPIAVHYSENNWHASTIESGIGNHINNLGLKVDLWMAPNLVGQYSGDEEMRRLWGKVTPKGHYASASKNFYLLLHDLGFQVRTMARQEVEAGELSRSGIKLFILPFVVSLSDAEVQQIRGFVESGGVLLADYHCGLRDIHCRIRTTPALDDVFGIRRDNLEVRRHRALVGVDYHYEAGAEFEAVFRERVRPTGARVWGYHADGTPACLIHEYGKGKAIYLNADLYAYERMRRLGTEQRLRELVRRLLIDHAKLSAAFVPGNNRGDPLGKTEVTRFRDGGTFYFGVLPDYCANDKSPKAATLIFPDGMAIYDVRAQQYLGDDGMAHAILEPGQAKMYAALPYRVKGVTATTRNEVRRGERLDVDLVISGTGDKLSGHTVHVEVLFPDGTKPEYLARTLYLAEGKGTYSFVTALNAPRGRWKVTVIECVSGKRACLDVNVE